MPRYRRGAVFVMKPLDLSTPLDRNQRAKILFLAERLERSTKRKGRRNGIVSQIGLQVLRALVLGFQNSKTGLCVPSYSALQEMTGLCRQSIANALSRLEATGIITVTRRIVRKVVEVAGMERVSAVQGSNLYAFAEPGPWAAHLPLPEPRQKAFPAADMIARLARSMSFEPPSLRESL